MSISNETLACAQTYTDESLAGAGAVAGKPCQIQSIAAITGGNRVTFLWLDNNGVSHTSTMDVMNGQKGETGATGQTGAAGADGKDGVGIKSMVINSSNHLIITYTDDNSSDAGEIPNVQADWNESDSSADSFIKNKPSLGTAASKDVANEIEEDNHDLPDSDLVHRAVATKQDILTFDNAPTENSNNPVKSGGIYTDEKAIYEVMGKMGAKNLIYVEDFTLIKSSARTKSLTTEDFGNDIPKTQVTLSFEVSDSNLSVNGEFRAYAPLEGGVREFLGGAPFMADGTYSFSFDATKLDQLYIFINNEDETTATCKIGNVMIRFATDTDATYQPYAMTNRELTKLMAPITGEYVVSRRSYRKSIAANNSKTRSQLMKEFYDDFVADIVTPMGSNDLLQFLNGSAGSGGGPCRMPYPFSKTEAAAVSIVFSDVDLTLGVIATYEITFTHDASTCTSYDNRVPVGSNVTVEHHDRGAETPTSGDMVFYFCIFKAIE